jgi:hypothetical protein
VRAALAAGGVPAAEDVAAVIALLDEARTLSSERWEAIGRLAPAAKGARDRAQDAARLLAELRDALRAGSIDQAARAEWVRRIGVMLGGHG